MPAESKSDSQQQHRDFLHWLSSGGKPTIATVVAAVIYSTWFISGKVHEVESAVQRVNDRLDNLELRSDQAMSGNLKTYEFDTWLALFKAVNARETGSTLVVPDRIK